MKRIRCLQSLLMIGVLGLFSSVSWSQMSCMPGGQLQGNGWCAYPDGSYMPHQLGAQVVLPGPQNRGGSSVSQPPKIINRYGAVALNKSGGSFGSTRMASSEQEAIKGALADCGGTGCSIFSSYKNQCVAMAWGKKNKGGMNFQAFSLQSADAENSALKKCTTSKAQNCQIVLSECSKYK